MKKGRNQLSQGRTWLGGQDTIYPVRGAQEKVGHQFCWPLVSLGFFFYCLVAKNHLLVAMSLWWGRVCGPGRGTSIQRTDVPTLSWLQQRHLFWLLIPPKRLFQKVLSKYLPLHFPRCVCSQQDQALTFSGQFSDPPFLLPGDDGKLDFVNGNFTDMASLSTHISVESSRSLLSCTRRCTLVRSVVWWKQVNNFHPKVKEHHESTGSAPEPVLALWGFFRIRQPPPCDNLSSRCWQLGTQVRLTQDSAGHSRLLYTCSPERGKEEIGWKKRQPPLWSAQDGTAMLWPSCHLYRSLAQLASFPAMRCHRNCTGMESACHRPIRSIWNSKHTLFCPPCRTFISHVNIFKRSSHSTLGCCWQFGAPGKMEKRATSPRGSHSLWPSYNGVTKTFCCPRQPPALPACEIFPGATQFIPGADCISQIDNLRSRLKTTQTHSGIRRNTYLALQTGRPFYSSC